jgi:hypothetical protein
MAGSESSLCIPGRGDGDCHRAVIRLRPTGRDGDPKRRVIIRWNCQETPGMGSVRHQAVRAEKAAFELDFPPWDAASVRENPRHVESGSVGGLHPVHPGIQHLEGIGHFRVERTGVEKALESGKAHTQQDYNKDQQRQNRQRALDQRVPERAHGKPLPAPRTHFCSRRYRFRAEGADAVVAWIRHGPSHGRGADSRRWLPGLATSRWLE